MTVPNNFKVGEYKFTEGEILLIDKPLNWTSFDAVNKLRWEITHKAGVKKLKVGHSGTLDPLATGLIIICTGKSTKLIDSIQAQEKEYTGSMVLGATRPSYDMETEIDAYFPTDHITEASILDAAKEFIGEIDQIPPLFSAIKKDGKRLYEHARAGREMVPEPRRINIMEFEITAIELPRVDFRVKCSKGTYIRSLAYDMGLKLGSGAYLSALRRTKIGDYSVDDARTIIGLVEEISGLECTFY